MQEAVFGDAMHRVNADLESSGFGFLGEVVPDALPEPTVFDTPPATIGGNGAAGTGAVGEGSKPVALKPETEGAFGLKPKWLDYDLIKRFLRRGETGDAEMLAELYTDRVVFDHSEQSWHHWTGHRWKRDRCHAVRNLVANEVAAQYHHGAALARRNRDGEAAKALASRGGCLRSRRRKTNVLFEARSLPTIALTGDEWDANPWLLGAPNGTIDLKTGELRPGQPQDYIRDIAPTPWHGLEARAPRWERFLLEIFGSDGELVDFLQRLLGYGITGQAVEHKLPVLWGEGRNGKDTMLETLNHVLGELAAPVQNEVLLSGRRSPNAASPHVYALRELRLAWSSETEEGARLAAGQVKLLTGGGTLTARPLYGSPVTFRPRYLFLLITNHKPHANADDYALWKRLLLVPFEEKFVKNPREPHEHKADPYLAQELRREAPGILAWLVKGCLAWQERGLDVPPKVARATQKYQDEEDIIGVFFEDCCVLEPGAEVKASCLFQAYVRWCDDRGGKSMSQTSFGRRMSRRFEKVRRSDGHHYRGIGLVSDGDRAVSA